MSNNSIAVGVPMYSREKALNEFLQSIPEYVTTAYIADNGHTEDHWHIYNNDWPFRVEVIDLQYDVGIGPCRSAIVDAVEEPYLWVGDNDMEFVNSKDLLRLRKIIEENDGLGGVSGWLKEPDQIRSGATDLHQHGSTLYKSVQGTKNIEEQPYPHAIFDMIPQAALVKTEIFNTYAWDARLTDTEHLDFFFGHKQSGDWEFASTPSVVVLHNKNVNTTYRMENQRSKQKDIRYLARKWGVEDIQIGPHPDWVTTRQRSVAKSVFDLFRRGMPASVWIPVRRGFERVGIA